MSPLTLMATTSLSLGLAAAEPPPSTPPAYPDPAHVINGCYISTMAYVARFAAEYPCEKAWPSHVASHDADGESRRHTIALLTWQGKWWGRDEYFGVFPLNRPVGDAMVTERVLGWAERQYNGHSDRLARNPVLRLPNSPPSCLPMARRVYEIAVARQLLPLEAEQFWVRCGAEEIPLLFFRPAPGQVAVYDPPSGTASAEIDWTDNTRVVRAVATRMGYRVDGIRTGAGLALAAPKR